MSRKGDNAWIGWLFALVSATVFATVARAFIQSGWPVVK